MNKLLNYTKCQLFYLVFPVFLALCLIILLFFTNLSFDFFAFKIHRKAIFKTIFVAITLIPVFQLLTFETWKKADIFRKVLLFGIALFTFCINFHTSYSFQIFGVFALCCLFYFFKKREFFSPPFFYILMAIYFIYNAISIFWSSDTGFGLQKMGVYALYLLIPLIFSAFRLTKQEIDMILLIFIRAMFFFLFVSLCSCILQSRFMQISSAQWFNMHGIAFFNYDDVHKVITNRDILFAWLFRQHETYYSFAYIFAFFLSIYYFLRRKTENRINIVDFIFGLILVILYSVFSHARIALVFIILAMALGFGYKLLNHKKLLVVLSVACAVAGTVCVIIFWDKFIFFISDGTRPTLFQIAWENICQRPFFGAGLGGLKQIFTTAHSSAGIDINFTTIFHPHNQFLADWMQTGIFGLAIMLFIVIYTFYYAIKQRDFLIFVFMLMWLQMLLIESPMISERGVFYFVLPMCILMQRK